MQIAQDAARLVARIADSCGVMAPKSEQREHTDPES